MKKKLVLLANLFVLILGIQINSALADEINIAPNSIPFADSYNSIENLNDGQYPPLPYVEAPPWVFPHQSDESVPYTAFNFFTDYGTAHRWIGYDFGTNHGITKVVLLPYISTIGYPHYYPIDYDIQISDNGKHWDTIISVIDNNNPVINQTFPVKSARFIRIYVTKAYPAYPPSSDFRLGATEFEIFGISSDITLEIPAKNEVFNQIINSPVSISGTATGIIEKVEIKSIQDGQEKTIGDVSVINGKFETEWDISGASKGKGASKKKYTIRAVAKDNTGKEVGSDEIEIYISSYGIDIPSEGKIIRCSKGGETDEFKTLLKKYENPNVEFESESKTDLLNDCSKDLRNIWDKYIDEDRYMQQSLIIPLDKLADSVNKEWNGVVKLRITEAWDAAWMDINTHSRRSAHYEGRALDIITSDGDVNKYPRLAAMAIEAGFAFVKNEGNNSQNNHIHVTHTGEHASIGITVTSPNGGENLRAGTTHNMIRWSYTGNPVADYKVKIELLKADVVYKPISSETSIGSSGNGSYDWNIPHQQNLGSDYKIRVTSITYPAYSDVSDASFTIS